MTLKTQILEEISNAYQEGIDHDELMVLVDRALTSFAKDLIAEVVPEEDVLLEQLEKWSFDTNNGHCPLGDTEILGCQHSVVRFFIGQINKNAEEVLK